MAGNRGDNSGAGKVVPPAEKPLANVGYATLSGNKVQLTTDSLVIQRQQRSNAQSHLVTVVISAFVGGKQDATLGRSERAYAQDANLDGKSSSER
jgi:hypothetical protein